MRNLYIASGLLLAGLAGTLSTQSDGGASSAKTKPASPLLTAAKKPADGPYSILCSSVTSPRERCVLNPELTHDLDVVIAFVPDPYRTHLRLQFDRSIEAILWAAQDSGYGSFQRYWIPWTVADTRQLTLLKDQKAADAEDKRLRKLPGLLLFREGERFLAVLLVGESPTAAFDPDQLAKALSYWRDLTRQRPNATDIPIIGPCFSGTLRPLQSALEAKRLDPKWTRFRVISGTNTSLPEEKDFEKALQALDKESHYSAVSISDDVRVRAFTRYLCPDTNKSDEECNSNIAVVSEDETDFAQSFKYFRLSGRRFRFPRGIAYVRNAYQDDPGLAAAPQFGGPRRSLQLNLRDPQSGHDSVPEFAEQTPASQETQMMQIAAALHHEKVQFAAVISTDILDTLFVSRFLRSAAPDTRLIFFDSDLLSTRSGDGYSLAGTLQVTTYPLFPERQQWLAPPPDDDSESGYRYPFSSEFEEGIYNATRAVLGERSGSKPLTLYDYEAPGTNSGRPPLWLTTVGRDGYWPISLLTLPKDKDLQDILLLSTGAAAKSSFHLIPEKPPRTWWALAVVCLALVICYLLALWSARPDSERWCSDFSVKSTEPGQCARAFYLLSLTLAAAATWLTLLSGPIGFFANGNRDGWLWTILVPGIAILGVLLACCGIFSYRIASAKPQPFRIPATRRGHYVMLMPIPWMLFLAHLVATILTVHPDPYLRSFFYSYRSLEIGSGVSPMLPFLFIFLSLGCWSFVHLQRRIFAEERYQLLPGLGSHAVVGVVKGMVEKIEDSLEATFPRPIAPAMSASAVIFALAFLVCRRQAVSLEGSAYDWSYSFAIATLAALLCISLWRLSKSWKLLEVLLEQLELHPIRYAFKALPAEYSWSPIWQQSPRKRSYVLLSRAVDCLRERRAVTEKVFAGEKEIEDRAADLLSCVAQGKREPIEVYRKLQHALASAAEGMVEELDRSLWTSGSSESVKDEHTPGKPAMLAQEFVALRFLAFIRYAMLQLRNLLTFITFGYVLLAFSLGCYPYQSPHMIAWTLGVALIVITVPVMWVFLAMEKDATLSRITDTQAGKVDWGFYTRAAAFGVLPVLSVLASHFPAVGQYVFSWVQPMLRSLH